jgi:hypothetical protein
MRVYIQIPDALLGTLQDQARAAHRPPRYHLEWLVRQALQERPADERPHPRVQELQPEEKEVVHAGAEGAGDV